MNNSKPILFNSEMVRAVLDGRKTQTRRIIKSVMGEDDLMGAVPEIRGKYHFLRLPNGDEYGPAKCPYGLPEDELWVRETWATMPQWHSVKPSDLPVNGVSIYYQDDNWGEFKRRPSIFMPRWASRITLKVTNVRVERVQDISEEDAIAEGCSGYQTYHPMPGENHLLEPYDTITPSDQFSDLWDSINAKRGYGWDANPWVWVVAFENKTATTAKISANAPRSRLDLTGDV